MNRFFTFLLCLLIWTDLFAQESIEVEKILGVESLVKNIFIKGNCRNVSNIKAIGNEELSIGQFKKGTDNIKLKDGIILSTGTIDLAQGPNIDNESGFGFEIQSTDPDLSQSATSTLFDVTGIEFEFVPLTDRITFRYVFASEEYCEFVGTEFNDVFGFFVSGPGINGTFSDDAINVASIITLDGTEEIVSINSINHLFNETFYVSNITTTDAQNCEISYNPSFQEVVEYDGFTIPLIASFAVIPCETYRIRLVLGDVGDAILDSAVFLESNSFDLGEDVTMRAEVPDNEEPISYEGCIDGQFVFTRSDLTDLNRDLTVQIDIDPESDAINGVDFEEIPLNITIPAGDTQFILPIRVIEDDIIEGPETLKLKISYDCDCLDPAFSELIISEVEEFSASFDPITVCPDQTFSLSPMISGGVPPYNYLWNTGATEDTLNMSISASTSYEIRITDFCGRETSSMINIDIQEVPTATLSGSFDLCETSVTGIPIAMEGNPPWSISYSIDGLPQDPIEDIFTNSFTLITPEAGSYELNAFSDAYCIGEVSGEALVTSPISVEAILVDPSCSFSLDGSIEISTLDAVAPYTIEWNDHPSEELLLEQLGAGIYDLRIVDVNNCLFETSYTLTAQSDDPQDCIPIYIPNIFTPNNNGNNDYFSIVFSENSGISSILSFQIYSRWGALIFEQKNFLPINGTLAWRGEYNGQALNAEIYVYKVVVQYEDGQTVVLNGDITLIR